MPAVPRRPYKIVRRRGDPIRLVGHDYQPKRAALENIGIAPGAA